MCHVFVLFITMFVIQASSFSVISCYVFNIVIACLFSFLLCIHRFVVNCLCVSCFVCFVCVHVLFVFCCCMRVLTKDQALPQWQTNHPT